MILRKNVTIINFAQSCTQSRISISFSCTVFEIQNTGHSEHISPREVVQARFRKKMRRSYTLRKVAREVEFPSVFRAPSQKFIILAIPNVLAHGNSYKILAIPNVLAHRKSYEHGFMKKCDGHKL
ncbi:hypothetical protein B296_00043269 [Ensete ventricosum]|uniref:Uncharacterized protein n=1 Tax=Ensete ventricosum TaxID=4639 RepID=A0A426XZZ0_ENSVE|nr:hypothetical protein B296_00043269 [Ensete ventricosum]